MNRGKIVGIDWKFLKYFAVVDWICILFSKVELMIRFVVDKTCIVLLKVEFWSKNKMFGLPLMVYDFMWMRLYNIINFKRDVPPLNVV